MMIRTMVVVALTSTVAQAAGLDEQLPQPWHKHGAEPAATRCRAGVDRALETRGTANLTLQCDAAFVGFVGAMQSFEAAKYLGRRVRFSALVKTADVGGFGGLWMRVDDHDRPNAALATAQDHPVKGTADWSRQAVVLDASANAERISFGFTLNGAGQIWLTDPQFEVVGNDVPTTGRVLRDAPANLELAR
jgi:hypothetical protein